MPSQTMPKINLLKMPDPAAQTAKYVNMMNATKQMEAAERQAAIAQKTLDLKTKEDVREEAKQGPTITKMEQDNLLQALTIFRNAMGDVAPGDVGAAEAVRADLIRRVPGYDQFLPPAAQWTPEYIKRLMMDSELEIQKTIETPTSELIFGPDKKLYVAGKGGLNEGLRPLINKPAIGTPAPPMRAPPPPAAAPPMPAATAPQMPAAPPTGDGGQLDAFQQDHVRRMKEGLGMTDTPASFTRGGMSTPTAGQMTPDMVPAILDSAINTGVMAQIDLDQMLALAPPQARDGIMQVIRSSNIALQADAPSLAASGIGQQQPMAPNPVGRQQSTYANLPAQPMPISNADLGGQLPMRNTMAQTNVVGQQAYGRSTSPTSPAPADIGLTRRRNEAAAERPSKQELYDAEAAKIQAIRDAGPAPVTAQQKIARRTEVAQAYSKTQTLIDKAYDPKEGIISIANKIKSLSFDQKEAITGYSGYVPSFRESSREADTLFGNLKGVVTSLGKDAAAASGAVGNMAVQEWKIAADMIANLDLANMTPRALDAQMDRIIRQVSNATNLAERVYNIQYGDDLKEYPDFKLRGTPPARIKTPVTKAPSGVTATEWKAMTPAERKLWQ